MDSCFGYNIRIKSVTEVDWIYVVAVSSISICLPYIDAQSPSELALTD